jgi:hypothetical protein
MNVGHGDSSIYWLKVGVHAGIAREKFGVSAV